MFKELMPANVEGENRVIILSYKIRIKTGINICVYHYIYLINFKNLNEYFDSQLLYIMCFFYLKYRTFYLNIVKRNMSFWLTARFNVNPWGPNANCVSSSHCVRLSMAAGYVRLSRVISGNFARRLQCIYMQEDYSQVPTFFLLFFFLWYTKMYFIKGKKICLEI